VSFQGQWADALLVLERMHLSRLALWGAASILAGTGLLALLRIRRTQSPLLDHFALQTTVWGALALLGALIAIRGTALRDLAGATTLDRTLWFAAGASVGVAVAGAVLAGAAWRFGRRLGAVGAGIGVALQGVALLLLALQFIASVVR